MRLLHVIHSLDRESGGPVEALAQRTRVLQRAGHLIEVATLDPMAKRSAADEFAPTHYLGNGKNRYGYSPEFVPWLREEAGGFDAVTVHGLWQFHGYGTWRALRGQSRPPYYVFPHGMLDPWFKRTYPLKHLKKWLYWPWAEYRVLRDARAVLFTSEEERQRARESFWLYRVHESVVNYGTAAPEGDPAQQRGAFLRRFPQLAGKRCVLFLGRMHVKKGPELLLRAFAAAGSRQADAGDDIRLVMAGPNDNAYGQKLSELATQLGLRESVVWTGMLTGDEKWGALRCAEVFVLPSHQENFGVAVAEAVACGVPVLISNRVNIWREIEADRAGFVDDDDFDGTARLLEKWLGTDPDERKRMGRQAQSCFEKRFNIERTAHNLIALIEGSDRTRMVPFTAGV